MHMQMKIKAKMAKIMPIMPPIGIEALLAAAL